MLPTCVEDVWQGVGEDGLGGPVRERRLAKLRRVRIQRIRLID